VIRLIGGFRRPIHRAAGVNEQVNGQIFFLHKELEEEALQPGVGVPIYQPEIVAGHIVTIIGKLDRLASFGATALSLPLAALGLPSDEGEGFEAAEEGFVKEGGGRWGRWRVDIRHSRCSEFHGNFS
jgi:hypothetical protein